LELVNGPSVERLLKKALREGRPGVPLEQAGEVVCLHGQDA